MCRLIYGSEHHFIENDALVIFLNTFMKRNSEACTCRFVVWLERVLRNLGEMGRELCALGTGISDIVGALTKRIEKSQQKLKEKINLDLQEFKVYYFSGKKWKRIKGKSVKKSSFGLWVNEEIESRFIDVNEWEEVLVCRHEDS